MGKKVREYKSGDFIFAKVKGYPAWPARVQKMNGKKYFVYFYGTGETANLPPNMIFDYAENKDKFLTKTQKRRDFNDGVKQIEHDFANNVPLEEVIGVPMEVPVEPENETADSALGVTLDDSANDTIANDTANDTADQTLNTTQNDGAVEDSDDAGNLVIDEGKTPAKGKKAPPKQKDTPKETPKKEMKTRGKKKEDKEEKKETDDDKKEEEVVSRSGRKIKPKRYIDEETEENTLQSPAPKKRRGVSPVEKEKEKAKSEVNFTQFNAVKQSELEGLKAPFKPVDEDKDNILIAYLPTGTYVGVKLFQSRPTSFKNEQSKLQWDKQAASNAITLKYQLERDQITPESVQGQLVTDLNLTDEEKVTLDKERETEEKKARVQFLKTEMKLIELDAKIKTCLCLEKADTELCLTLLDELIAIFTGMEVRPLMLLKHPTCLETVKRMRAYVGNTPSWDLNEKEALVFSKQAHKIRKKADTLYQTMKDLFSTPDGLSFWEYFSERVVVFKKATSHMNASELLEMVHEPLEMTQPTSHTMSAAVEEANKISQDDEPKKKKQTPAKTKKTATPSKPKRQSRRHAEEEKEEEQNNTEDKNEDGRDMDVDEQNEKESQKEPESAPEKGDKSPEQETQNTPDPEQSSTENTEDSELTENTDKDNEKTKTDKDNEKTKKLDKKSDKNSVDKSNDESSKEKVSKKKDKDSEKKEKDSDKKEKDLDKKEKDSEKKEKDADKKEKDSEKKEKDSDKKEKDSEKNKDSDKKEKDSDKNGKEETNNKEGKEEEKESSSEPRAKRSRESKKTEAPPPRSPAKRKSKV